MFRASSAFDKALDKATSHLQIEPDLASIIQISDTIRQGDCQPKYVFTCIKKKLANENPHTVQFTLDVLESVVKNCGRLVHDEIASKSLMDALKDVLKAPNNKDQVKQKALGLIQSWAVTFKSDSKFKVVQDTFTALKNEGHTFQPVKESDAMYSAEVAPEWTESTKCYTCSTEFTIFNRKHHCRACGQIFCQTCASHYSNLPKYGIEKAVRICTRCHENMKTTATSPSLKADQEQLPAEYANSSLAQQKQATKSKTAEELKEEEDLEMALAISQSEAEAKEMEKKRYTFDQSHLAQVKKEQPVEDEENEDPELARYLNRNLWEQKQGQLDRIKSPDRFRNSPPSAPETPTHQLLENGLSDGQLNEFVAHLKSQVEIFVNRMKSNSSRGRSISNDSSVQSLFLSMTTNHSKLLEYIAQKDELRTYFEGLQDKLTQVKDALAALDALREEHQEKLQREAEEAERLKQIQMAEKLHIMRKKKQEILQQQRQMAIQKLQDEAMELHTRRQMQNLGGYVYSIPQQGAHYPSQPSGLPMVGYQMVNYPGYPVHQAAGMPAAPQHQQQQQPIRQPLGPIPAHMQGPQVNMMGPQQQQQPPPPPHLQQYPMAQNIPMGHQPQHPMVQQPPGLQHPMAQSLPPMPPPGMVQHRYPMGPMGPPAQPYLPPPQQHHHHHHHLQQQPQMQQDQSTAELIRFD